MNLSPREIAAQTAKLQRDQERLYKDLLGIVDALDHACTHWQQAIQEQQTVDGAAYVACKQSRIYPVYAFWRRVKAWLSWCLLPQLPGASSIDSATVTMTEVVTSAHQGVEMIRKSLLDLLQQRQVLPLEVLGQPFDPSSMYALGRQESADAVENTVLQEVVKGYVWQSRVLREPQVIVAIAPPDSAVQP